MDEGHNECNSVSLLQLPATTVPVTGGGPALRTAHSLAPNRVRHRIKKTASSPGVLPTLPPLGESP